MTGTETKKQVTHPTFEIPDYIDEWANEFYKAKKIEGVSIRTQEFYRDQLRHFMRFCDGQMIEHISQISAGTIRDFMVWMGETGHNPGGIHAAYRVLKTFLRWFEKEAEPDNWHNPIAKVKAPHLAEEPLEPVELKTVSEMIATCDRSFLGKRDRTIMLFLLDTGLRARELLSLNVDDVNFVSGGVRLRTGKGRKPREVFIGKETRKAARAYLKDRQDDLPALFVFDDFTKRLGYGGLRAMLKKRARLAKVTEPTAHDFRRAFAINMLRNGVDVITLARIMGHSALKVLQRYLKQINDDLQEAHQRGGPVDHSDL